MGFLLREETKVCEKIVSCLGLFKFEVACGALTSHHRDAGKYLWGSLAGPGL